MFKLKTETEILFDNLCQDYYNKIYKYLYGVLGDEISAKDATQDVFILVWQKIDLLKIHPNIGGFIFQTAKIISKKAKRESFTRFIKECSCDEDFKISDPQSDLNILLDKQIDEQQYIDKVLLVLPQEKLKLYSLYYISGKSMEEISKMLGISYTALRMRYVRLREEIRDIVKQVAEKEFL